MQPYSICDVSLTISSDTLAAKSGVATVSPQYEWRDAKSNTGNTKTEWAEFILHEGVCCRNDTGRQRRPSCSDSVQEKVVIYNFLLYFKRMIFDLLITLFPS